MLGYYQFGTISGYTWEDLNGNGQQDDGTDLDGVSVTLSGTTGNGTAITPVNTTTSGGGLYTFTDIIPGTYTVHFDIPGGMDDITLQHVGATTTDSDPDPGTGDTDDIDIVSGDEIENIDAGFFQYISVGDLAWDDLNGNGIQDGEPGLDGVNVTLNRSDGSESWNTTTAGGLYSFSFPSFKIRPGEFYLTFAGPAQYFFTDQDQGSDVEDSDPNVNTGNTINFTLNSGESTTDWDAGFYKPFTVGDYCWRDLNTDGIQDSGEPAMADVAIELFTSAGVSIGTTTSDANGNYAFGNDQNMKPGDYYLVFTTPATFNITLKNVGPNEVDSDIDEVSGWTDVLTFESGEENRNIDAGYYVIPPTDCPSETAGECEEADVLCELFELNDFCKSMVPAWEQVTIPGCGGGYAFHNPSWFAFIAGSTNISLIIHANGCVSGGGNIGIQWGIYDDCDMENPIALQCDCVSPGDIRFSYIILKLDQHIIFS
ncbi:MAG: SdrD B-like domain-containing protein [Saprospiraceae bacterium]